MPLKTQLDETPSVNLTPMIDIVFLLMIFFMVGTKFTELEKTISLQVPAVNPSNKLESPTEALVLNVSGDGSLVFDGKPVATTALAGVLTHAKTERGDFALYIRGDEAAPHGVMARVYSACRRANIQRFGVAVTFDSGE
ncbi:MAG: biopolymer transporter ExbD [Pirellulales bacterium]|nr:biopolymer transporter ExbD [Pirellulales bacterium]